MAELLDAGLDLGGLALCYVAIALLLLVVGVLDAIDKVVPNPSIGIGSLSWKPLNFLHDAVNAGADGVEEALNGVQTAAAKFQSGLLDSLTLLVGIPLLVAVGIYDLFVLLWTHSIKALINSATGTVAGTVSGISAKISTLEHDVTDTLGKAKDYADGQVAKALSEAKVYSATNLAAAASSLEADIKSVAAATAGAIVAADLAAGGAIKRAIDAAIDGAGSVGAGALAGEVVAAIKESAQLRDAITSLLPAGVGLSAADVTRIIGDALNPGGALVAEIQRLIPIAGGATGIGAGEVAQDIADAIAGALNPGGAITVAIAGAIAGALPLPGTGIGTSLGDLTAKVAAAAAAIAAVEAISFIGGEECRGKVGQICNIGGNDWTKLLAGAAALGVAFNLADVVRAALAIVDDVDGLIEQVGAIAESDVEAIGQAIGQAALAIAA